MSRPRRPILVVDDNTVHRYLLARSLRADGWVVLEAEDGRTALAAAATTPPGVAVVDIQLPDFDGYEVCRRLKEGSAPTPKILLTSALHTSTKRRVLGLEQGADAYLAQPFEGEELIANVRALYRLFEAEVDLQDRAQRLAEADLRKDEFLAMLAHELRNPLFAMSTATRLLEQRGSRDDAETQVHRILRRQLDHLTRLVDDLLEVSRSTRGRIELRQEWVDVDEVVRDEVRAIGPRLDERRQTAVVHTPGPVRLWADATRVRQMVANLLDNASRYGRDGGVVGVRLDADDGEFVSIAVEDDGIGIAADQLDAIFGTFVQGPRSLARQEGGLGLGLALVRALARLHGGDVTASSDGLGMGSVFRIRLPRRAADEVVRSVVDAAPAKHALRLLIVEDNRDTAQLLAQLCEAWGHEVTVVYDGREAVVAARRSPPDVALVDIGLPGLDGYGVARALRQQPWGERVRLLAITGYGTDEVRKQVEASGFDGHFVKPVSPDDLHASILGEVASKVEVG